MGAKRNASKGTSPEVLRKSQRNHSKTPHKMPYKMPSIWTSHSQTWAHIKCVSYSHMRLQNKVPNLNSVRKLFELLLIDYFRSHFRGDREGEQELWTSWDSHLARWYWNDSRSFPLHSIIKNKKQREAALWIAIEILEKNLLKRESVCSAIRLLFSWPTLGGELPDFAVVQRLYYQQEHTPISIRLLLAAESL